MPTPTYVLLPEHESARCSECDAVTVLIAGQRFTPFWRETQTGRILCEDCKDDATPPQDEQP